MSRIAKKPISMPEQVKIDTETSGSDKLVKVSGPKGNLECRIAGYVELKEEEGMLNFELTSSCNQNNPQVRANFGTARALVNNCITGVTEGWNRVLELHGVGYNAKLAGSDLTLAVGYSHPVVFTVPDGVTCQVEKNTTILLSAIDKQQVSNFAAKIRKSCPPEPYLGKGIRFQGEHVRRKAGKAGAKG